MAMEQKDLKNRSNEVESVDHLTVLKFNLERQNDQANALIQIIEKVEQIESNVNEKYSEVKEIVSEVRDRVTIDHETQKVLQSIVGKKSYGIANEYYKDKEEYGAEIRELAGYAIRHHWKLLKDYFRVTRYTSIRHVDAEKAKGFLENLVLDQSFISDYEQWRYQRIKKKERELEMTSKKF